MDDALNHDGCRLVSARSMAFQGVVRYRPDEELRGASADRRVRLEECFATSSLAPHAMSVAQFVWLGRGHWMIEDRCTVLGM
jgi:hypothetical protein